MRLKLLFLLIQSFMCIGLDITVSSRFFVLRTVCKSTALRVQHLNSF